ncbi:hypothetical protein SCHPADRAFT_219091 [Schizopora paradoxa]|uniref:Uncharacterized protein n=1 Tax=Schizopora paradoxa TaxID=27342 RepID=A0A0H2RX28_9AGAM|nr:hypothetical protein SCHPADRAFT_219091 [Schizopora paradoxa]
MTVPMSHMENTQANPERREVPDRGSAPQTSVLSTLSTLDRPFDAFDARWKTRIYIAYTGNRSIGPRTVESRNFRLLWGKFFSASSVRHRRSFRRCDIARAREDGRMVVMRYGEGLSGRPSTSGLWLYAVSVCLSDLVLKEILCGIQWNFKRSSLAGAMPG